MKKKSKRDKLYQKGRNGNPKLSGNNIERCIGRKQHNTILVDPDTNTLLNNKQNCRTYQILLTTSRK